jgi:hypothetical protein
MDYLDDDLDLGEFCEQFNIDDKLIIDDLNSVFELYEKLNDEIYSIIVENFIQTIYNYPAMVSSIDNDELHIIHYYFEKVDGKKNVFKISNEMKNENIFENPELNKYMIFIDRIRSYLVLKTNLAQLRIDSIEATKISNKITVYQLYYYTLYRNGNLEITNKVINEILDYDNWMGDNNIYTCIINDYYSPLLDNFDYLIKSRIKAINNDDERQKYINNLKDKLTNLNLNSVQYENKKMIVLLLKALIHRLYGSISMSKIYITAAAIVYNTYYSEIEGITTSKFEFNKYNIETLSLKVFEILINDRPLCWVNGHKSLFNNNITNLRSHQLTIMDITNCGGYYDTIKSKFNHTTRIQIIEEFIKCITKYFENEIENSIDNENKYKFSFRIDLNEDEKSIQYKNEMLMNVKKKKKAFLVCHYNSKPRDRNTNGIKPINKTITVNGNIIQIRNPTTKTEPAADINNPGFEYDSVKSTDKLVFHFTDIDVHVRSLNDDLYQSALSNEDVVLPYIKSHSTNLEIKLDSQESINIYDIFNTTDWGINIDKDKKQFMENLIPYYSLMFELDEDLNLNENDFRIEGKGIKNIDSNNRKINMFVDELMKYYENLNENEDKYLNFGGNENEDFEGDDDLNLNDEYEDEIDDLNLNDEYEDKIDDLNLNDEYEDEYLNFDENENEIDDKHEYLNSKNINIYGSDNKIISNKMKMLLFILSIILLIIIIIVIIVILKYKTNLFKSNTSNS